MPRWTESDLRDTIAVSDSLGDVLRAYGLRAAGGNYRQLGLAIERWQIPVAHFTYRTRRRPSSGAVGIPLLEVLTEHSTYHRGSLKRRLYREGLKERRCELCGLGEEWNGAPISLVLDHVNGVHDDNRLENLRIVCPNCNATLPTHCGRNLPRSRPSRPCAGCGLDFHPGRPETRFCSRVCWHRTRRAVPRPTTRRVPRPPLEQLLAEIAATSWAAVGRKYGVSDNAIRKWVRVEERARAAALDTVPEASHAPPREEAA